MQGFQHFFNSQKLRLALDRLSVKGSGSTAWRFAYSGGDGVAPMTPNTQTLHSDWPGYKTSSMMRGYAICVSLALRDVPLGFAPMRFVSWAQLHRKGDYPSNGGGRIGWSGKMYEGHASLGFFLSMSYFCESCSTEMVG